MALDLVPEVEGESPDQKFRMMGVYAKNCEEWAVSALAIMSISGTVIAFYDTLGADVVEFILN
jgi:long-subunit acyl-CoA synthetase (AMP-forming)